jgi:hypothetical protein
MIPMEPNIHIIFATSQMRDRMEDATRARRAREARKVQGGSRIFRGPKHS